MEWLPPEPLMKEEQHLLAAALDALLPGQDWADPQLRLLHQKSASMPDVFLLPFSKHAHGSA
jgi:hypothetical protein